MKTKKVTYYADLLPGWHDDKMIVPFLSDEAPTHKTEGTKRVKVIVELPVFGGSAEIDNTVEASTEVQETGLKK